MNSKNHQAIAGTLRAARRLILALVLVPLAAPGGIERSAEEAKLAVEVQSKGWIAYGARPTNGDWDLFLCRPDGSTLPRYL